MALSNERILQNLSNYLSGDFRDRIPAPTQANMNQIADTIEAYPTLANEFIDVLTNQVIRTMFFTRTISNPLSFFERGELSKYGKSLELIYVDLIQGKDFTERFGTSYENELLAPTHYDNVKVQYLTENSRLKYKITISTDMLASAFRSENGLSTLVNQQVSKMVESYNLDKFLMTWKLLDKMNKVDVPTGINNLNQGNSTEVEVKGKQLLRKIKKVIKDMSFPSRDYNTSGVWTVSRPEDLAIIIDTETAAMLDVEVLAGIFNLSKVEMASRIIEIPRFGDEETQALIVDRDKVHIYQTKYATDSIKNGAGLFTNIFLHRWDLLGACDFANCIRLSETGKKTTPRTRMPYDVLKIDSKDENGTVMHDMVETEIELNNGEVKSKRERKIKK